MTSLSRIEKILLAEAYSREHATGRSLFEDTPIVAHRIAESEFQRNTVKYNLAVLFVARLHEDTKRSHQL